MPRKFCRTREPRLKKFADALRHFGGGGAMLCRKLIIAQFFLVKINPVFENTELGRYLGEEMANEYGHCLQIQIQIR